MVKVAIAGYGNIGKYALEAIEAAPDMECAGIIRRNASSGSFPELSAYNVVTDILELGKVDAVILSTPSRAVRENALRYLEMGINTVDSFDIHAKIPSLKAALDPVAKAHGAVSVISAGWDPGTDSIIRALALGMIPDGTTYTNFGPGRSMGHTVAAKAIAGVKDAISITIPEGKGIHSRKVYVRLEEGASFDEVSSSIKTDSYFAGDATEVIEVEDISSIDSVAHGVNLVRDGASGRTGGQKLSFDMRINNPALTGQVMVNMARASVRQNPGCYTMIEIPVIDMLPGDRDEIVRGLV